VREEGEAIPPRLRSFEHYRLRRAAPRRRRHLTSKTSATQDPNPLSPLIRVEPNIVDEFTREALAMRVGRRCTADDVIEVVEALVAVRGAPANLRMDNGPELIAKDLRDWCPLRRTATSYIEPGSPWENPFVESFNGRVRDELLNIEEFATLLEAQVIVEAWRVEYNTYRSHPALGGLTPAEFAAGWTINQPALP
jgi:putative transposase